MRKSIACCMAVFLISGLKVQSALVAEWRFDEVVGGDTLEDKAGTLNGVVVGNIRLVPSDAGEQRSDHDYSNAYVFIGNDADETYVSLGSTEKTQEISNFGTGPFTIAGWFEAAERNVNGSYRTIFSNIGRTGGISINLGGNNASNRGRFQVQVGVGSDAIIYQSEVQYDRKSAEQQWHWFAVTSDGATLRVYIDGSLVDTIAYQPGTTATPGVGSRAFIGRAFDGSIDQLAVWDQQLTGSLTGSTLNAGELYDLWKQGVLAPRQ